MARIETVRQESIRRDKLASEPLPWTGTEPTIQLGSPIATIERREVLRHWCIAGGITPEWAAGATDYQLQTAWKSEAYFAKIVSLRPSDVKRGPRSKSRNVVMTGSLDELDELAAPATTPAPERQVPELFSHQQPLAPAPAVIDAAAIARAAEAVISAKFTDANKRIEEHVSQQVEAQLEAKFTAASERVKLSDALRQQVRELATESAKAIARVMIDEAVPKAIEVRLPQQPPRVLGAEPRHRAFDEIVSWLAAGEHVYIVGGAGTGKTHLFKQVAVALGYDLETEFFPIDQAMTKYDVKGYKNPQGEFVPTAVYHAMKNGGFMCIDEGDMWTAASLGALNSGLANDFVVFGDELVPVHPRFRCIIAANTFGRGATAEFIGRNPLDAASLDRFAYVIVDYDPQMERQLYGADEWTAYVQRVRAAVAELKIRHVVSMRATQRIKRGLAAGLSVEGVLASALWRGLDRDSIEKIKAKAGPQPQPESQPQPAAQPAAQPGFESRLSNVVYQQFIDALSEGQRITAIKLFKVFHGNHFDLRQCEDWVEDFRTGKFINGFESFINPGLTAESEAA
jgi:cobaltochelatase CobS